MLIILSVLFSMAGCSICDPSDNSNGQSNARFAGTYKLTAWNAPVPVDMNQDGSASRNLMTESQCYHPSKIILDADRNYVRHEHYPQMESASCGETISTGVWTAYGNTLKLLPSDGGEEMYAYGEVNKNLTRSVTNYSYPVINDGITGSAYGDVNMVFTKE